MSPPEQEGQTLDGTEQDHVLAFAHIGDLHLTDAKQRNFLDFLAIVAQIEIECGKTIDFVVLPGDNADNGRPSQYALAATALKMLSVPVHAIPATTTWSKAASRRSMRSLAPIPCPRP